MRFSAQEEYGLRCLVALAKQGPGGSLTIPEISKQEGMTPSHVAKLMAILRRAGFEKSTRGQLGGYTLAKSPAEMPIRAILEPLGGRIFGDDFCLRYNGIEQECVHKTDCLIRPMWEQVQYAIDSVVNRYTLADIMESRIESPPLKLVAEAGRPHPSAQANWAMDVEKE